MLEILHLASDDRAAELALGIVGADYMNRS